MRFFLGALLLGLLVCFFNSHPAAAGEIDDFKKDLAIVQAQMAAESARADAAASEIGRIRAVFPQLQAREKDLVEKIQALEKKTQGKSGG